MSKYVIIGNGTAAVGCIEGIRTVDDKGDITVISSEPYHTYSRPLISYLLCGKTTLEKMKYRKDDFYSENNVAFIGGKTAVKIDKDKKNILLDDGSDVVYEKLLIATGAAPFVPPTAGYDTVQNKFTFLSLDDAMALDKAIGQQSQVLIIGAGPVGLKCAEGIRDKVAGITVVDMAPRILPAMLDETGSDIVKKHLEDSGIRFVLGDYVEKYDGNTAKLKSGKTIPFDVLVTAVGVKANISLLTGCGGKAGKGIIIDGKGETTVKDIFAAGDCTQCADITTGEEKCLALLPNAYMQGHSAGVSMAGGAEIFDKAIPMNAVGLFGLHLITAGNYMGEKYVQQSGGNYKMLAVKDNLLKGFILIGDVNRAGIYTSLIREQTPLDAIDFELIREKPQLMAFTRKDREKKLSTAL
jgi:NAD(P)H-nitrite reductase large subunit